MSPPRFGSDGFLEYNGEYCVLICRKCGHAIQPKAVNSHLLRDGIYRAERMRIMSSVANLDLQEPEKVPVPPANSPPIDGLTVFFGWSCREADCGFLTMNDKRMKKHAKDAHGLSSRSPEYHFFRLARRTKLQTFFVGNKLRYFEVADSPPGESSHQSRDLLPKDSVQEPAEKRTKTASSVCGHEGQPSGDDETAIDQRHSTLQSTRISEQASESMPLSRSLDMHTLTDFHHFIFKTSLTLPGSESSLSYWQPDVVDLALKKGGFMAGLLAISAFHQASEAKDQTLRSTHRKRASRWTEEFSTVRPHLETDSIATVEDKGMESLLSQVSCILECANRASSEATSDNDTIQSLARLKSVLRTIRGCAAPPSALQLFQSDSEGSTTIDRHLDAKTSKPMAAAQGKLTDVTSSSSSLENAPEALLTHLSNLPSRLASFLDRPQSAEPVLMILKAVALLTACCEKSYNSDSIRDVWAGVAAWLTELPDAFEDLLDESDPGALIVFLQWSEILIGRARECGCWFLEGVAKDIKSSITQLLPKRDGISDLLELPVVIP